MNKHSDELRDKQPACLNKLCYINWSFHFFTNLTLYENIYNAALGWLFIDRKYRGAFWL
jgi:hypothetical protein